MKAAKESAAPLPRCPGFTDPMSLQSFIARYFFIHLKFGVCTNAQQQQQGRVLVVPPMPYAVYVYVSLAAPPPPQIDEVSGCSPISSSARQMAVPFGSYAPVRKELARAVLSGPLWSVLLTRLGPRGTSFLLAFCPVVVQFACGTGGLHVLGPSMKECAPVCGKRYRRALSWSGNEKVKKKKARREVVQKEGGGRRELFALDMSRMVLVSADERSPFGSAVTAAIRREHAHDKALQNSGIPLYDVRALLQQCKLYDPTPRDGMSPLERHVSDVLCQLLKSVSRLNIRGAALKHFGFIESRIKREADALHASSSTSRLLNGGDSPPKPINVQLAELPIELVLSYLETLMGELSFTRRSPVVASCSSQKVEVSRPFLGEENLQPFIASIGVWLTMQKRAAYPLSIALRHIKVSRVPWLEECSTRNRKLRSALQQAIFGAISSVFFRDIIPVLVERSIHVTWSPRNPRVFQFYSKVAWDILQRHEMNAMCSASGRIDLALARPRDVWCRARSSAIGNKLLYASIRLLPDGCKLRPIATIRCGNASALAALAQQRPFNDERRGGDETRKIPPPAIPRAQPNHTILRKALLCLICGLQEHRRKLGVANIVNSSHLDEYPLLLSFVRDARTFFHAPVLSSSSADGHHSVHLLRADASRCYDRLPQKAVVEKIDSLVTEPWYYTVRFHAIHKRAPGTAHCGDDNHQGDGLARRSWITTLSETNFKRGHVPNIPSGWIVEECESPDMMCGDDVRRVLHDHCSEHFVVVDHRLFTQRSGIIQGSAVAMLLCDALLEEVDLSLAEVLSLYEEPSFLLRRVDDILVGSLSSAAAEHAGRRCAQGWEHCGFLCNHEKLVQSNCDPITWCGLLIFPQTLFVAVDWGRLLTQLAHNGGLTRYCEPGEHDVMLSVLRLIGALQMRMPLTAFCTRINTPRRAAGTMLEAALIFSRYVLSKVLDNEHHCRQHLRLFLRPLAVAISAMATHVTRKYEQLDSVVSSDVGQCRMSRQDIRVIFSVALRHTVHAKLRFLVSRRDELDKGAEVPGSWWSKRFWFLLCAVLEKKQSESQEATDGGVKEAPSPWLLECIRDSAFLQGALHALRQS